MILLVNLTNLELDSYKEKIKENQEKINLNKQLPYLVGNIVEILEMNPEDEAEENGANIDIGGLWSEVSGDREVQRTMLELLNQLDGFSSDDQIKVIAATNHADILDPALMRSGQLDRKIEFPHPTEEARARILQIHSRKMNVHPDVNFEELARSTDDSMVHN
ncbi:putative proteasome endopeptidase complex [Rosa chinensis]|uniref:Putative proteasome endopeptidase complex n=1 Tax=Rosa chinensis TaxID=74649 RepID=A0A2P6PEY5_ROSCH|nr:putative proteasome endopeptidase complex [Rosa chinensis]